MAMRLGGFALVAIGTAALVALAAGSAMAAQGPGGPAEIRAGDLLLKIPSTLVTGQPLAVLVEGPGLRSATVHVRGDGGAVRTFPVPAVDERASLTIPWASLPRAGAALAVHVEATLDDAQHVSIPEQAGAAPLLVRIRADSSPPSFALVQAPGRIPVDEQALLLVKPEDDSGRIEPRTARAWIDGVQVTGVTATADLIVVLVTLHEPGPHALAVEAADAAGNRGRQEFALVAYRPFRPELRGEFTTEGSADYGALAGEDRASALAYVAPRLAGRFEAGPFHLGASVEMRQEFSTSQVTPESTDQALRYSVDTGLSLLGGAIAAGARVGRFTQSLTPLTLAGRTIEEGWALDAKLGFIEAEAFFGRLASRTPERYARHVMGARLAPLALGDSFELAIGAAFISDQYVDGTGRAIFLTNSDGASVGAQENLTTSISLLTKLLGFTARTELATSVLVRDIVEAPVPYGGGPVVPGTEAVLDPSALYRLLPSQDAEQLYYLFPIPTLTATQFAPLPIGVAARWSLARPLWSGGSLEVGYSLADSGYRTLGASVPAGKEVWKAQLTSRFGSWLTVRLSAGDEREVVENAALALVGPYVQEALEVPARDASGAGTPLERERRIHVQARLETRIGRTSVAPLYGWSRTGTSTFSGLVPALLRRESPRILEGIPSPQGEQTEIGLEVRRLQVGPLRFDLKGARLDAMAYQVSGGQASTVSETGFRAEAGVGWGSTSVRVAAEQRPDAAEPGPEPLSWTVRLARSMGWWSMAGSYGLTQPRAEDDDGAEDPLARPQERFELSTTVTVPALGGAIGLNVTAGAQRTGDDPYRPSVSVSAQYGIRW